MAGQPEELHPPDRFELLYSFDSPLSIRLSSTRPDYASMERVVNVGFGLTSQPSKNIPSGSARHVGMEGWLLTANSTQSIRMLNKHSTSTPGIAESREGTDTEWLRQIGRSLRSLDALAAQFPQMRITDGMREAEKMFPLSITPYYASQIQTPDFSDPIFSQSVPNAKELISPEWLSEDPLMEQRCSPSPFLIHRYPDRILIVATSACATYCRHCTRKRVSSQSDKRISDADVDFCVAYLQDHPRVDDVLLSGGDPLTLSDAKINTLLTRLRSVKSVKVIRIASRTLVTLPMRITPPFVEMLKKHSPIYINTHFNHPCELTPEAITAANLLTDAGIPVGNQTVLLRGINDSPEIIETLCRTLFHNRIRPYYLFQCDLVRGIEHLRTPLQLGIEIMKHLRGTLSGLAIPNFAVDTPGHGGKVELLPEGILRTTPEGTFLKNGRGEEVFYPDPVPCPTRSKAEPEG